MKGILKMKKSIALLLAATLFVALIPTVSASENEITVYFNVFDGTVLMPKEKITVPDGIAEEYGYITAESDHNGNSVDGATVFDAIVSAHKKLYGDAFTPETCENYLVMTSSFITKSFGRDTASSGFFVNDRMPNDGIYNEGYGSYTGFACDTAVLEENDIVTYFFYQDLNMWSDYKADFEEDEITAKVNEKITVCVTAFSSWYGNATEETIKANSIAANGCKLYCENSDGSFTQIATLDENGKADLSFNDAGEYTIYVAGTLTDAYGESPVVIDWATINVEKEEDPEEPNEPEEPEEKSLFQKILDFFKVVINKIIEFFVWLYNSIAGLF